MLQFLTDRAIYENSVFPLALVSRIFAVLGLAFVVNAIASEDAAISVALNKLVGLSPLIDRALEEAQSSNVIGSVIVALIWWCWFRFVKKSERIRIMVGMLATLGAGILSRLLQLFLKLLEL